LAHLEGHVHQGQQRDLPSRYTGIRIPGRASAETGFATQLRDRRLRPDTV